MAVVVPTPEMIEDYKRRKSITQLPQIDCGVSCHQGKMLATIEWISDEISYEGRRRKASGGRVAKVLDENTHKVTHLHVPKRFMSMIEVGSTYQFSIHTMKVLKSQLKLRELFSGKDPIPPVNTTMESEPEFIRKAEPRAQLVPVL